MAPAMIRYQPSITIIIPTIKLNCHAISTILRYSSSCSVNHQSCHHYIKPIVIIRHQPFYWPSIAMLAIIQDNLLTVRSTIILVILSTILVSIISIIKMPTYNHHTVHTTHNNSHQINYFSYHQFKHHSPSYKALWTQPTMSILN
jgi:hypothetical protein